MGFSRAAVPAAENAFAGCDCLLAIGTRFGEIPTGSFGCRVPENLIHVDIDPAVLGRNFPAKSRDRGRRANSRAAASRPPRPSAASKGRSGAGRSKRASLADKKAYREEWLARESERVNPARFFDCRCAGSSGDDAIMVVDDGNHTFLAAELFPVAKPRRFVSPTDFNCMGYAVPAAIGAKLANPDRQVVGDRRRRRVPHDRVSRS